MSMTDAYLTAMKASYANQEGGITIPADQLDSVVEIPLGFQPMGIASRPNTDGGDEVVIAAYYEPAICTAVVKRDDQGLHFAVSWIRGVDHGIQSVRLFPDLFQPGGANRAQTVNFGPDGTLWVSRNAERDFYVLSPPEAGKDRWRLIKKVTLPTLDAMMVHSALVTGERLYTIESNGELNLWSYCAYAIEADQKPALDKESRVSSWFYGIGIAGNGHIVAVTDYRAKTPHGIYDIEDTNHEQLLIPDIWGNGICFLSDGSALVPRYGQSPSGAMNGMPGALVYVPANLFNL